MRIEKCIVVPVFMVPTYFIFSEQNGQEKSADYNPNKKCYRTSKKKHAFFRIGVLTCHLPMSYLVKTKITKRSFIKLFKVS